MKNQLLKGLLTVAVCSVLVSCANQLPPPGGPDDTDAPEILEVFPKPSSKNFLGNEIVIRFNEFVDKRSFIESFRIYPEPKGVPEISWSGKDAFISFPRALEKNTTYVITLGNDLRDIRGGNALPAPAVFAFSTGSRIDTGAISGKVVAGKLDRVRILLYKTDGQRIPDPSRDKSDYSVQPNQAGSFIFPYLPDGRYRVFAVYDDDRNSLWAKDIEKIAVANMDIDLKNGSSGENAVLIMENIFQEPGNPEFLKSLAADSSGRVFASTGSGDSIISGSSKIYLLFKNLSAGKQDIVQSLTLFDSASARQYKPVFNWLSDSLLEIFSAVKFSPGSEITLTIDLTNTADNLRYERSFKVTDKLPSVLSGSVEGAGVEIENVIIVLSKKGSTEPPRISEADAEGRFSFSGVQEGEYRLIAFIDSNGNGKPDAGSPDPFAFSERILVYDRELNIKSGWNVEDVRITFGSSAK